MVVMVVKLRGPRTPCLFKTKYFYFGVLLSHDHLSQAIQNRIGMLQIFHKFMNGKVGLFGA